jgi:uncharacterized protein YjbI with pentapeptide repeats
MAIPQHLALLKESIDSWNAWRMTHSEERPDLSGADLRNLNLRNANLSNADLRQAFLDRANAARADFRNADLSGASLVRSCLCFANLEGASLDQSNLTQADLGNADLSQAVLVSANLFKTNLAQCRRPSELSASASEHTGYGANITGADLTHADLRRADMTGATAIGAIFHASNLQRARMRNANLETASFRSADLRHAQLSNARLARSNLTEANLCFANLLNATLTSCQGLTSIRWNMFTLFYKNDLDVYLTAAPHATGNRLRRHIADQYYIHELNEDLSPWSRLVMLLWKYSSYYGQSLAIWALWCVGLAFLFGLLYTCHPHWFQQDLHASALSPWYFSVATITTLGLGDILPKPDCAPAQFWIMVEVILGYIMLGGLISIFANKLARRS